MAEYGENPTTTQLLAQMDRKVALEGRERLQKTSGRSESLAAAPRPA
jgi:hypothetical protein